MSNESQDNNSTTEQVVYDLDALVDTKKIITISTTALKESAKVQESLVPIISSIGSMFAGLQKSGIFASSLKASVEATKAITAHIAPTIQSIQPFTEMISNMAKVQDGFAKQLLGALDIARDVSKRLQESMLPLKKLLSPIQNLQKGWFGDIAKNIGSGVRSILSAIGNLSPPSWLSTITNIVSFVNERFRSTLQSMFEAIRNFQPFALFRKFVELAFFLLHRVVVDVASGDNDATELLVRLWHRKKSQFDLLQKLEGTECSREETDIQFKAAIQRACFEYLYDYNDTKRNPLFTHYRAKRYFTNYLRQEHRKLSKQYRLAQPSDYIPFKIIDEEKYIFTEIAAAIAGKTPQAIRDWIKSGALPGRKYQYASFMAGQFIDTYIIPYNDETLSILKDGPRAKLASEKNLISAQDIIKQLKVSSMYLTRCEKDGLVIPTRIGRFKYYTAEDRIKLLWLLTETTSPKLISLVPEFKAQLAYYTAI